MDKFKKVLTDTACATLFLGHRRWLLLFILLPAQVLPTVALGQTGQLKGSWPAFDYDGKPARTDGSKKTVQSFELQDWTVTLQPRSFQLVFYQKRKE